MRKYLVFYWRETGDDKDWFEKEIQADSIDEALIEFRKRNPLSKIDSIELITKDRFVIRREVPRKLLENVFVTALEGGSNYWYYLPKESIKIIRTAVPKEQDPYLATAMLKAVLDHNAVVPIHDVEDEEEWSKIGEISSETILRRLQKLSEDEGLKWCLDAEFNEQGDAETSDVVFQFLALGEYVYG
jgi:hypothetical protein